MDPAAPVGVGVLVGVEDRTKVGVHRVARVVAVVAAKISSQ